MPFGDFLRHWGLYGAYSTHGDDTNLFKAGDAQDTGGVSPWGAAPHTRSGDGSRVRNFAQFYDFHYDPAALDDPPMHPFHDEQSTMQVDTFDANGNEQKRGQVTVDLSETEGGFGTWGASWYKRLSYHWFPFRTTPITIATPHKVTFMLHWDDMLYCREVHDNGTSYPLGEGGNQIAHRGWEGGGGESAAVCLCVCPMILSCIFSSLLTPHSLPLAHPPTCPVPSPSVASLHPLFKIKQ